MNYSTETGTAILTDDELLFLNESTPFTEGSGLTEFLEEAAEVAKVVNPVCATTKDNRVRLLLLMRGFYFLGVLRGGEAYRDTLTDDVDSAQKLSFDQCSVSCTELFADDLNELSPAELAQVCAAMGF